MKPIARMSPEEVAGLVCETLQDAGITVTLTGGGCVAKGYGYRHFDVSATQRTCQEIMAAEAWNPHTRQR